MKVQTIEDLRLFFSVFCIDVKETGVWYNEKQEFDEGGDTLAKHEFGIMQIAPEKGKRYDEYEPQKYDCISVNDDYLEDIVADFNHIDFYWHSLDIKGKGIAYCGVTLIPPDSINAFVEVIEDIYGLSELRKLSKKAITENKWMIHFGL